MISISIKFFIKLNIKLFENVVIPHHNVGYCNPRDFSRQFYLRNNETVGVSQAKISEAKLFCCGVFESSEGCFGILYAFQKRFMYCWWWHDNEPQSSNHYHCFMSSEMFVPCMKGGETSISIFPNKISRVSNPISNLMHLFSFPRACQSVRKLFVIGITFCNSTNIKKFCLSHLITFVWSLHITHKADMKKRVLVLNVAYHPTITHHHLLRLFEESFIIHTREICT